VRIGIVSQWYPPEPVSIPADLADELSRRGHTVRVLTGFPNYPGGELYEGYEQRWRTVERHDGVTVRRVPLYASHDASGLRRAANYLSFAATSSVAASRFLGGADVVYVYLTPATVFAAPALLRLLRGVPSVVHVQDVWPDSVTASPLAPRGLAGRAVNRTLTAAVRQVYRLASGIVVIAPSMRDLLVARGADPEKIRVVLNWTNEALFRPVTARAEIGRRARCTFMYAGAMGPFQNVGDSVCAAAAVADVADLVLVGSGIEEDAARAIAADLKADNVRFLGRRPADEMAALYAAADFQLVTLRDLPMFRGTIPSKLQAALACGSPVLVSVPGDCAELVERTGVGLACPPEDWRALADRMRQAAKLPAVERAEMGRRALETYRGQMSLRAGVDQIEEMLRAVS
jgi:glycosyltransferase involved in cell wall biosynthesis